MGAGIRWIAISLFLLTAWPATVVHAQHIRRPPAANQFLGTPLNENFGPNSAFAGLPPAPPPPPKPQPQPVDGLMPDPPRIWTGSAELGINGAYGNSDVFNMRTSWHAERKTTTNLFVSDFLYVYTLQDKTTEQQQALFNVRDEILFADSPWSSFVANQIEYDELRAYRFRVGVYAGCGLLVKDRKDMNFRIRAGAGAQREMGKRDGPPTQWVPEAVMGYDFRYRMDDRNGLVSVLDYFPRIDDWGQFRVRARLAYEFIISPENGAVLRMGVQERYDSNPGNGSRNDINYFTTLGFRF